METISSRIQEHYLNGNDFKIITEFEKRFKDYHNMKYSVATNSATSALHLSYYALGIKSGDQVIVPNYTFPATALPLFPLGGIPVLVDCQKDTANIDPTQIEEKITLKTKAIAVTHLWGHPCEMDEIQTIASKYNLPIIEDCAHSPGAKYKNKLVGTFGKVSCFSFDNQKLLASGEGGILLTNSKKIYEESLVFGDFGDRIKHLDHPNKDTGLGLKYRMHPLAAVIANDKTKLLDDLNHERVTRLDYFTKQLLTTKTLVPPVTRNYVQRGGYYGYKVIYKGKHDVDDFIRLCNNNGVDVRRTVTPPLHMTNLFSLPSKHFLNSTWFYENHLSFNPDLDYEQIDNYIETLKRIE